MSVVLSLGIITLNVTVNEIQGANGEKYSLLAYYNAEAGVERAVRELKKEWNDSQDWSSLIGTLYDSISFNEGEYNVVITDNGSSNVIVTAEGTAPDGSAVSIEAEIGADNFSPGAALYLNGNFEANEISFATTGFLVSGDDYGIGDKNPTTTGVKYGLSTSGISIDVPSQYNDKFKGTDYDPVPNPSIPSIQSSAAEMDVQELINYYSQFADHILEPGTYNNDYGGEEDYKIVYATGDITLSGDRDGYGLLISRGSISITEKYRWVGIILVGDQFSVGGGPGPDVKIYGMVYVGNSSGADEAPEIDIMGKSKVVYSSEAINKTQRRIPLMMSGLTAR
jgi:hypothetical protein